MDLASFFRMGSQKELRRGTRFWYVVFLMDRRRSYVEGRSFGMLFFNGSKKELCRGTQFFFSLSVFVSLNRIAEGVTSRDADLASLF